MDELVLIEGIMMDRFDVDIIDFDYCSCGLELDEESVLGVKISPFVAFADFDLAVSFSGTCGRCPLQ
jgi:hypothetical protein